MLAVLFTKMSSEEVMGDKSLIFDIIGGEKSRPKDGDNNNTTETLLDYVL